MPQVFKMGPYLVYFWSNENEPLEPVHVHISKGTPSRDSTKVWLTKNGRALLANNGVVRGSWSVARGSWSVARGSASAARLNPSPA